jgi:antitoxin VapB
MSITIELTDHARQLASRVAERRGVSIEQAVEEAITESARKAVLLEERAKRTPEEIIRALDKLSLRHVARPVLDPRSIDEIIGYDELGLPQ